jgi:hypothetical protein
MGEPLPHIRAPAHCPRQKAQRQIVHRKIDNDANVLHPQETGPLLR